MSEFAIGTKLFSRTDQLQDLLSSVPADLVSTVYLAHDGEITDEKQDLFYKKYQFETVVIDLPYDAGVGVGKNRIVEACDEEFLLMVDTDHRIPPNVLSLKKQLLAEPDLGGIAGSIVEPEQGRLWQSGKNLYEDGNGLIRDACGSHQVKIVAGVPLVRFDFVPAAVMLRTKCLEDYQWDENYIVGSEHLDFHIGHWKQTNWSFAINPSVNFEHYPGGGPSYMKSRHGQNVREGREYFKDKWGYDYVRDRQPYWYDTESARGITAVRRTVSRNLPTPLYKNAKQIYDRFNSFL